MNEATKLKTRADAMMTDMSNAIELVIVLPNGHAIFQQELEKVTLDDATDISALARLISMANATLAVAETPDVGAFGPWYRDKAEFLLVRAMEVLAVIEAQSERRADSRLN